MIDILSIYLDQIATIPLLDTNTQQDLATRAATDPNARQRLIEANLRLVVPVARSFAGAPMPLMDRIQEGNIGLIKAAETYNPDQGALFATWATNRIKWHIYRAIQQRSHLISVPVHVQDSEQAVRAATLKLLQTLGRMPRHSEVRKASGLSRTRYRTVIHARELRRCVLSLDKPINEESDDTLLDMIAAQPIEHERDDDQLSGDVRDAFGALPRKEQRLITALFGLNGKPPLTASQAAKRVRISPYAVGRTKKQALAQLREMLQKASAQ